MDLVSRSEKGAIISEHHKVGKGKCFAQCVNQNSEGRRSFFFYFSLSLFFFLVLLKSRFYSLQLEQTVISFSAELCNGNEKRRYLFLTTRHKTHGKREVFYMYVN